MFGRSKGISSSVDRPILPTSEENTMVLSTSVWVALSTHRETLEADHTLYGPQFPNDYP